MIALTFTLRFRDRRRRSLRDSAPGGETSSVVAERVAEAWQLQIRRAGCANSRLEGEQLAAVCAIDDTCWSLLESAAERFNLSARAHQRLRRVARTIADLARAKNDSAPTRSGGAISKVFRQAAVKGPRGPSVVFTTIRRPCSRRRWPPRRQTGPYGHPWQACSPLRRYSPPAHAA